MALFLIGNCKGAWGRGAKSRRIPISKLRKHLGATRRKHIAHTNLHIQASGHLQITKHTVTHAKQPGGGGGE